MKGKRIIALLLALSMAFAMVACGNSANNAGGNAGNGGNSGEFGQDLVLALHKRVRAFFNERRNRLDLRVHGLLLLYPKVKIDREGERNDDR